MQRSNLRDIESKPKMATTKRYLFNILISGRRSSQYRNPLPLRSLKPTSLVSRERPFIDTKRVRAVGGRGGDGCISFLQIWCNDKAGPDGGDGGNGGHVILQASFETRGLAHVTTLMKGEDGEKGSNNNCHGKSAPHNVIKVPTGTIIQNLEGEIAGDLDEDGSLFILARGGAGGHGNAFFESGALKAPHIAERGGPGEEIGYVLELKSMADFGLVGLPNAGKSTLLRAISRARPKVASYPFTTIRPHLGVVQYDDYTQITVADLPGLIEGSHRNRGLGIDFLKHVERCSTLVVVLDMSCDPLTDLETLEHEVVSYCQKLWEKQRLVVANKMDLPNAQENLRGLEEKVGKDKVICVSAKFGSNTTTLLQRLRLIYDDFWAKR